MADLAAAFAQIAGSVSAALGGPYFAARIITQPVFETDDGGSIIVPDPMPAPTLRPCSAQVDSVTEEMRLDAGFTEKDRRILVLASTLSGSLNSNDEIEMLSGPDIGVWSIQPPVRRDAMNVYYELRARPV